MSIKELIHHITTSPETVEFQDVIDVINNNYIYQPASFTNGLDNNKVENPAGKNEGSCKIFYFAKLNGLSKDQTLACFGKYYRDDVIKNPSGTDHANIRTFIKCGWDGVNFEKPALLPKP